MGLEIPGPLRAVASVAVGSDWPEADETSLRRLADGWDRASTAVGRIARDGDATMVVALDAVLGDVATAMREYWGNFEGEEGVFQALVDLCDALSESCRSTATDVEYAKLTIIAALVALAAEFAALAAAALPTAGVSLTAMPAAQLATQVAVRMAVRELVTSLLREAATSAAQNLLSDGAIQILQILRGDRARLDTGALVSGSVEGFVDGAVSGGVGRFASETALGRIGAEAVAGSTGSAASAVVAGDGVSWQDVASGAVDGAIGAAHDSTDAVTGDRGGPAESQGPPERLAETWNRDGPVRVYPW